MRASVKQSNYVCHTLLLESETRPSEGYYATEVVRVVAVVVVEEVAVVFVEDVSVVVVFVMQEKERMMEWCVFAGAGCNAQMADGLPQAQERDGR